MTETMRTTGYNVVGSRKNMCEPYLYGNETYIVSNFNITTSYNKPFFFHDFDVTFVITELSCLYKIKYSKRQTHKMNTMEHLHYSQGHNHKWKKRWKQRWKIIVETSKLQQWKKDAKGWGKSWWRNNRSRTEIKKISDKMVCHWL